MIVSEMKYKDLCKMQWEIVTNYRVLRHIRICKKKTSVAKYFGMHRNSVNNCIKCYEKHKTPQTEELVNEWKHVELDEIIKYFSFFTYESRKPHSFRWVAPPDIEEIIEKEYAIYDIDTAECINTCK